MRSPSWTRTTWVTTLPAALGSTEDAEKLVQLMVRLRDYANAQNAIMERRETTRQVDLSKGTDR